jgi:hypothetical protein
MSLWLNDRQQAVLLLLELVVALGDDVRHVIPRRGRNPRFAKCQSPRAPRRSLSSIRERTLYANPRLEGELQGWGLREASYEELVWIEPYLKRFASTLHP